jgi:hypothetical protein
MTTKPISDPHEKVPVAHPARSLPADHHSIAFNRTFIDIIANRIHSLIL